GSSTPHADTQDIAKLSPATRPNRVPVRIADVRRLETPTLSLEPRLDWGGRRKPGFGAIFRGASAQTSTSLGVRSRTTANGTRVPSGLLVGSRHRSPRTPLSPPANSG